MENNRIDLCAPEGETPIYDQIRQELAGRIRAGSLPDGTRLPTVRELSEQLHVAEGTVKRAYDELERDGLLIKTPGRGSFVCYHRTADRRQAAQEQIDALLQQLHQMGISVHEMKQLFADQLRRFCAQQPKLQVALVECNPEVLAQLEDAAPAYGRHRAAYPAARAGAAAPRAARTADGCDDHDDRTCKTACRDDRAGGKSCKNRPAPAGVQRCADRKAFARAARRDRQPKPALRRAAAQLFDEYTAGGFKSQDRRFLTAGIASAYLSGKDAVLVPEGYEKLCTQKALGLLTQFAAHARLISCSYQIDEGSAIYLTERLERLLANRSPK